MQPKCSDISDPLLISEVGQKRTGIAFLDAGICYDRQNSIDRVRRRIRPLESRLVSREFLHQISYSLALLLRHYKEWLVRNQISYCQ